MQWNLLSIQQTRPRAHFLPRTDVHRKKHFIAFWGPRKIDNTLTCSNKITIYLLLICQFFTLQWLARVYLKEQVQKVMSDIPVESHYRKRNLYQCLSLLILSQQSILWFFFYLFDYQARQAAWSKVRLTQLIPGSSRVTVHHGASVWWEGWSVVWLFASRCHQHVPPEQRLRKKMNPLIQEGSVALA